MGISAVCLASLLSWAVALCTSEQARWWLAVHRRMAVALFLALALPGAVYPARSAWQWHLERERQDDLSARTRVLTVAERIDGIELPAGTTLLLAPTPPGGAYESANLPQPTRVGEATAVEIRRYTSRAGQPLPAGEVDLSILMPSDQIVGGWRCSFRHRVEFSLSSTRSPAFRSCHLGEGNLLEHEPIPAGAWVSQASSNPSDALLLRTDGRDPLSLANLSLLKVQARLDARHRLLGFEGQLATETVLGPMTYPSGTGVRSAGSPDGDLIFSPSRGRTALRQDGASVQAGSSVLQSPQGQVRRVDSNRALGVLDISDLSPAP